MNPFFVAASVAIGSVALGWRLRSRARAASARRAAARWLRQSLRDRRRAFGATLTAWPSGAEHGFGATAARLDLAAALHAVEACLEDSGSAVLSPRAAAAERRLSRAWEGVLLACESDPSLDALVPHLEAPTACHNRVAVAVSLVRHTADRGRGRTVADQTLDLFGDPDDAWFALRGHLPTRSDDRALRSQVSQEAGRNST